MLELIEIGAFIFVAASFTASVVYWIWWAMGAPRVDEESGLADAARGRLLSFWGVWVAKRYNETEFAPDGAQGRSTRPNLYKALGACLFCFGLWAALLLGIAWAFVAVAYLEINPPAWGWAFIALNYAFLSLSILAQKQFEKE